MPWSRFRFRPGINKDVTQYSAEGTWVDGSLVRFRNGYPERWAGWVRYLDDLTLDGVCRCVHRWALLSGYVYAGFGTNRRFYVASDDVYYDVSPIAETATLSDPFTTVSGSDEVIVTDVSHGRVVGDILIISGASAVGGLTLSGEYTVTSYINDDSYKITAASVASSSATGGGASVTIKYIYSAGATDQGSGGGWSSNTWGQEEWGGDANEGSDRIGLWSQSNWGEDLVACISNGPIFYWDATTPSDRMINIRDLPGADGYAPSRAQFIAVSHRDRHMIAFGVGEEWGGTVAAPMTVRWCSQEDIYNWDESDEAGTAGSIPLSRGSRLIAVCPTQSEMLIWSDAAVYSMQFVGSPDVFIATIVSEYSDIAGLNCSVAIGSSVYWMGQSGFYGYDGRVQKVECSVWTYVQKHVNWAQSQKIYCASNKAHDEVIWFYQSINGTDNDSYVAYNVLTGEWTIGSLARTAWLDMGFQSNPIASAPTGELYYHDVGMDDGSQNPPLPINAYLQSAPLELSSEGSFDKGDRFMFIRRIIPDVTFVENDGVNTPTMKFVIKTMDKPGGGFKSSSSSQVSQTAILPVEEFTEELHVRLRGRAMSIRFESNTLGSQWLVGQPRYDVRTDGQR